MEIKKSPKSYMYVWHGKSRQGNKLSGVINSHDINIVKAQLRKQGVLHAKVKKKGITFGRDKKIKSMDITVFTRQMATMMQAGVPLLQSFTIIIEGLDNSNMRKLLEAVRNDIAGGSSFAGALRKHSLYFDELYCNLVASGETSGALETLLDRVATYKEKSEALKSKIKKAMNYPIAVVVVAAVVTSILLLKVVPQFQEIFEGFGAELPVFTQLVIGISELLQEYSLYVLIGLVLLLYAARRTLRRSEQLRNRADKILLKMPIIGDILYNSAVARYGRTLATTFSAGVPLVDALDSVSGAIGNVVFKSAVQQVKSDVSTGMQLHTSMMSSGIFPPLALQLIAIGEESGALDTMLEKVAAYYEAEVDNAVDGLTALLEPIIMVVLGVLIGGLVIAMYLPILQMGNVV